MSRPANVSGPMLQGVYIWQHRWNADVRAALKNSADKFDTLYVLVSDSCPVPGLNSLVLNLDVDYKFLASLKRPVCLVIRIGSYSGPFDPGAKISRELLASVKRVLREAHGEGLQPCEVQIDFDCAESKLAGYEQWLKMLTDARLGVKLSFTALPCWLDNRAFKKLAAQADEFVLQIHSFEPPKTGENYSILCSGRQAERWIKLAARVQKPFRIALPTYSYLVAFDAKGKFLGLSAEGLDMKWPDDTTVKRADSSVDKLADLITQWQNRRPAKMQGVIWFRLPTDGDRLNLSQAALDEIMLGRLPLPKWKVELSVAKNRPQGTDGAVCRDIFLENVGTLRGTAPSQIVITWRGRDCFAADAVNGYTLTSQSKGKLLLSCAENSDAPIIKSGGCIAIGWVRLPENTEVCCEIINK